jgi:predicted MFS family arabinose efflux permease
MTAASPKTQPTRTYAWLAVLLLTFVWLLNYLDRQVLFSVFPPLQQELHISAFQLGLLGTTFLWVYAFCSPIAGYLADKVGSKRMICASLLVWSAVTVATGHARTFTQLLWLRSIMGISEACYLPAGLALIAAYHDQRTRARAISLHYSGTYIGTVLGGTLGGWIATRYGWRSVFGIFGIFGCAYAIVLVFLLREQRSEQSQPSNSSTAIRQIASRIFLTPGFRPLLSVFAIASICDWAIYTWMPLYLFESFHFSLTKAGFTATFYMKAGGFAGLLIGGILADAWFRRSPRGHVFTQTIGLLLAAPFLILSGLTHTPAVLYIAMVLFGLGKGMYDGNTMPVLCEGIAPEQRATAFGMLNFAGTFCGGIVAAGAGKLKGHFGLGTIFSLCGGLLLFAGFLTLRIRMRLRSASLLE